MLREEIENKLQSIDQGHLLNFWDKLSEEQQIELAQQVKDLDIDLFTHQKELLQKKSENFGAYQPVQKYQTIENEEHINRGRELLAKKKCGCLILAGGQGTRLNQGLSKGLAPITPVKHKTLFQLFSEKTLAAGKQVGEPLPLAIMTSPQNHFAIFSYFESNHFFGLQPCQVSFFCQGMLPLLDKRGCLFLEDKGTMALGPDGNGSALKRFVDAGIWQQWQGQGIENVNIILVDNALADPFDAELLGFHAGNNNDVTIKSSYRLDETEKVGVLVEQQGKIQVVEYTEMDEKERKARYKGELKYPLANLSLFCFTMDFIGKTAYEKYPLLPLHKALKAAKFVDKEGNLINSNEPLAWKFEWYIFDLLAFADNVGVLVYPREVCFAPLKNATGADSLETVQVALQKRDKQLIKSITFQEPPEGLFELSQDFYYPTPDLLEKWKGCSIPSKSYLSADM